MNVNDLNTILQQQTIMNNNNNNNTNNNNKSNDSEQKYIEKDGKNWLPIQKKQGRPKEMDKLMHKLNRDNNIRINNIENKNDNNNNESKDNNNSNTDRNPYIQRQTNNISPKTDVSYDSNATTSRIPFGPGNDKFEYCLKMLLELRWEDPNGNLPSVRGFMSKVKLGFGNANIVLKHYANKYLNITLEQLKKEYMVVRRVKKPNKNKDKNKNKKSKNNDNHNSFINIIYS